MDPYIDLGNSQVRLSALRHDANSRLKYLAGVYRTASSVRCLCGEVPVDMGVARRQEPLTYYLYHLHRGDPALHHPRCPHRIEQSSGLVAPSPTTLADQGDDLASLVVHTPLLQPRPQVRQGAKEVHQLTALLEALFHASGLDVWHPGFTGHRGYAQVRYRLLEAAKRIRPFGSATLADLIFMPPLFEPAKREEIEAVWSNFLDQLKPSADGMVPRGAILGRVRTFQFKEGWSAPRIQLSESNLSLWLDKCPTLVAEAPNDGFQWTVLLAVEVAPETRKVRVLDGGALRVTPQWLPVHSPAHAVLANQLVNDRMPFMSSLFTVADTNWASPDLILTSKNEPPRRVHPQRGPALRAA